MLKGRVRTYGIGLLLICVSLAMGSCDTRVTPTSPPDTNNVEYIRNLRTLAAECDQLPQEKVAQCAGMSARMIANFEAYIQEQDSELDPDQARTMELEIEAAMKAIPGLILEAGISTEAACKVSDIGWAQCVRLADMLAEYDTMSSLHRVSDYDNKRKLINHPRINLLEEYADVNPVVQTCYRGPNGSLISRAVWSVQSG